MNHQSNPEESVEGTLAVPQDWQKRHAHLEQRYLQRRREKGLPELRLPEVVGPTIRLEAETPTEPEPEKVALKRFKRSHAFVASQYVLKVSRVWLKKRPGGPEYKHS